MKFQYFKSGVITVLMGAFVLALTGCSDSTEEAREEWIELWDGETFDGWRTGENSDSFRIEDGRIVVNGLRPHLFYVGPVEDADFTNFEFKADVYTYPNANSGIFFHTKYQEEGRPEYGYLAQVNATHSIPRKTGSLYTVKDVMDVAPHQDHEWFTYHITVIGKDITFKVNDEVVMEFTEPDDWEGTVRLGSGTFALQAHGPDSRVYYRNLRVRVLPD